ncbi:MAG TPA: PilZ domain-containing protein [Thermoanaerobaculia bacterium]|nr:PilZ domain-containing protein [Thermoanaerobaculia bacterium]
MRFAGARDYVEQYAFNLSEGGLFVAGATRLEPLQVVRVELELPGLGRFEIGCRVAHVLDEERARRFDRAPGAGLAIMEAPPEFDQALRRYLRVIGARRGATVLVADPRARGLLADTGYRLVDVDWLEMLPPMLVQGSMVVGIVVPATRFAEARSALADPTAEHLLLRFEDGDSLDTLLDALDRRLASLGLA